MEIAFPSCGDTPHYLPTLIFSRDGDNIVVQIADDRNREKARYEINAVRFNQMTDMLLSEPA